MISSLYCDLIICHKQTPFDLRLPQYKFIFQYLNTIYLYLGTVGRIFLAFSVYTNGGKMLSMRQATGSLGCLNGIRVISISWVILGHSFLFAFISHAGGKHATYFFMPLLIYVRNVLSDICIYKHIT
jgi:hypothetical protein